MMTQLSVYWHPHGDLNLHVVMNKQLHERFAKKWDRCREQHWAASHNAMLTLI